MPDEHNAETPEPEAVEPAAVEPAASKVDAQATQEMPPLAETAMLGADSIMLPEPEQPPAAPAPTSEPATTPAGSRVILIVSRGPSPLPPAIPVVMPDVTGEKQGAALLRLQGLGLSVEVLHDHSSVLPKGYVTGQHPMGGGAVLPSADAVLLVSSGRSKLPAPDVMLPNVVGLEHNAAVARLAAVNLIPRVVYDHDPVAVPGMVLAQIPSEGSLSRPLRKRGGVAWLIAVAILALIAVAAGAVVFFNRPISIPNLVGLTQSQAEQSVRLAGFSLGSVSASQTANSAEIGTVVGQAPPPGGSAPHGSTINLVVAGGQVLVSVPNVSGGTLPGATKALQDAGLAIESYRSFSSSVASGTVISQAPGSGQRVPPGTKVGVIVSMGTQSVPVPNVVGQVRSAAEVALTSSGLGIVVASNYSSSTPSGQVMGQIPTVGTSVIPGSIVGLTVSKGLPITGSLVETLPLVVAKTSTKAKDALRSTNMKFIIVTRTGTGKDKGVVVGQLPDQGTVVPRGSTVILFVSDGR